MSDTLKLGQVIESERIAEKDAIHIAVAPVTANCCLMPGTRVSFIGKGDLVKEDKLNGIGIVDPFLGKMVKNGERFWLWLNPGSITSLRHAWTHPDFREEEVPKLKESKLQKDESETWLINCAEKHDVTYDQLMGAAKDYVKHDEYFFHPEDSGKFEGEYLEDEFWEHYQKVTGEAVPKNKQASFFSCSC